MKVINLEEHRRAKRIQEVTKKQRDIWPAKERLLNHLVEKLKRELRQRLREKMREKISQTPEEDV